MTARTSTWAVALLATVSLALAATWAILLPIFLSPDEDSHYDYAVALYAAGRPMRPAENIVGRDTQPVVAYLMDATHARQQRLDTAVGADPGYGTRAYFRALDAGAPRTVAGRLQATRIAPVPYITRLYPIGYYALIALFIGVGDWLSHGSALAEFFLARFVSVGLLLSTLIFSWLAFLELGIGRRRAVLLLACTALLPLTAWMAGYVQPDNLVCALVAPVFYLALRRRRVPCEAWALPVLGLLLAALVATKTHYFVSVYLPIVAMLAARARFRITAATVRGIAWLSVPAAIAFAVTDRWLKAAPGASGVCVLPSRFALAAARGPAYLVHFMTRGVENTILQSFFPSQGVDSFWLSYTAYHTTELTLGTAAFTKFVSQLLPAISLIVTVLFLIRSMRVSARLAIVARERSWLTAVRLATSNVIVNAYFCYFAILIGVEVYLGGYLPVQGRYWLPFASALWLMTVTMAPKALPQRYARHLSTILLALILTFDIVASAATVPSLRARFYGAPHFQANPARETLAEVSTSRSGATMRIAGASVDLRDAAPAQRVVVRLDGRRDLTARPVPRPDVLCNMEATLLQTGFETSVPVASLRPGAHVVSVLIATPWSPRLVDTGATSTFTI